MDKYLVSINSIETYAYGMDKYLVCKKEEINCYNIIKACKNVYYGYTTKKDTKERNASWPKIPEHPYINS